MALKFYTAQDMKKAGHVGKRSASFQFIEGQGPKVYLDTDVGSALDFLQFEMGNLIARSKFDIPVEELAEQIKNNVLAYYKQNLDMLSKKKES